jgi:probable selenium-dependent hydroxylase accessory protein YqeC
MTLKEALRIRRGEVVSLVGGGGKTTLMFALARELASASSCVITTTTTKILEPLPGETPLLLLGKDDEELMRLFLDNADRYAHITLASDKLTPGKLAGIAPEFVAKLARLRQVSYIVVEADGAAHRSLKAPDPTEPVIPLSTSLVIAMVGVDAIGCRLTEEDVFRPEIVSSLLGLPLGEVISSDVIASLITHQQGIIKGSPEQARIVPFINKVDLDEGLSKGRDLAHKILAMRHPQIKQVVLGQARSPEPVTEVISQKLI